MKKSTLTHLTLLLGISVPAIHAQIPKYSAAEQYLMPQADEIALAKTAAPASISDRATIKVLTKSGFEVVQKGDNGEEYSDCI